THRGFRQANLELQELNQKIESRNAELARINRELQKEIRERKSTQKVLWKSKEHYRRLFGHARLMQEKLRDLSDQVLHAQEEERGRISRELHDEVGAALTAISADLLAAIREAKKGNVFFSPAISKRLIENYRQTLVPGARLRRGSKR